MSLNIDIAEDFAAITDWLRPVTVDGQAVQSALRRAVTTREAAASGGKYLASDTVFHLDAAEQTVRPAIGKQIADTDGPWTVLDAAFQTLANRWRCVCRQLWIDPSQTVEIQISAYTKGETGALEPTWSAVGTVVAKVEIDVEQVALEHGQRYSAQRAKVYFAQPQNLTTQNRIVQGDRILKLLQWSGFDPIAGLFRADCEVTRWPQS